MCDYSLHHVASRPAKVGDKLVTTQFNNSITRGFAAVGEPNVAVCLLPGTEVAFEKEVEFERGFGLFSSWTRQKRIGDKVARFRQLNADKPNMHHDALEFPDGSTVLVTRLYEGQHATVLQLPASSHRVKAEVPLSDASIDTPSQAGSNQTQSPPCLTSAAEVRKLTLRAWPRWTYGPNGERCWYSGEKPVFAKAPK